MWIFTQSQGTSVLNRFYLQNLFVNVKVIITTTKLVPSSRALALSMLSMDIWVSVLLILVSHMFLDVLCTDTFIPSLYQENFILLDPFARQANVSRRPSITGLSSWLNNFMECKAETKKCLV